MGSLRILNVSKMLCSWLLATPQALGQNPSRIPNEQGRYREYGLWMSIHSVVKARFQSLRHIHQATTVPLYDFEEISPLSELPLLQRLRLKSKRKISFSVSHISTKAQQGLAVGHNWQLKHTVILVTICTAGVEQIFGCCYPNSFEETSTSLNTMGNRTG